MYVYLALGPIHFSCLIIQFIGLYVYIANLIVIYRYSPVTFIH